MHFKQKENNRGFTLLFASLIAALLLAFGLSIFSINNKELKLSGTARDSQYAFYAADTGLECALYWDFQHQAFATSTYSDIVCGNVTIENVGGGGYEKVDTFQFDIDSGPSCVVVSVVKHATHPHTVVKARGYNTCDTGYSRRVERALQVTY